MHISSAPLSLTKLLTTNKTWYRYHQEHIDKGKPLREAVTWSVSQILSCKHYARGHAQYYCANKSCLHEKRVPFTCKNRMCNSCGKLASDKWVAKQSNVLPKCDYQHITMTMPSELWPFFEVNRELLTFLPAIASKVILKLAKIKKIKPGIFTALHTFGRQLTWNCHVHLSVTRGGITDDNKWKKVFFVAKSIMSMWRYGIITLLRKYMKSATLTLPKKFDIRTLRAFLDVQYNRHWHIHCAKPQKSAEKDIAYLGKYIKRPPLSNSRLVHYSGTDILFKFFDHRTKTVKMLRLTPSHFLDRFIKHIPDKGFRMIRYYGFLANRVRNKLLPLIYQLTETDYDEKKEKHVSWRTLYRKTFGANPLECILCHSQMKLGFITVKMSGLDMRQQHYKLACLKIIRH